MQYSIDAFPSDFLLLFIFLIWLLIIALIKAKIKNEYITFVNSSKWGFYLINFFFIFVIVYCSYLYSNFIGDIILAFWNVYSPILPLSFSVTIEKHSL